ncbi:hypothetical protein P879_12024, partial [Paragonimus westermani]
MYNLILPVDLKKAGALERRRYREEVRKHVIFSRRASSLNIIDPDDKRSIGNIQILKKLRKSEQSLDLLSISLESGFNIIATENAVCGIYAHVSYFLLDEISKFHSCESEEKYNSVPFWL